jgi:hypothetical protein
MHADDGSLRERALARFLAVVPLAPARLFAI